MTMPNFLIIGAARTGTTSLYNYLKQHPQIFMSAVKEPRFFAYENVHLDYNGPMRGARLKKHSTNLKAYESLFSEVGEETAIGEASVDYFYIPESAERIRRHIPDMKLVLILRQPVERAYSQFLARASSGIEPLTDFVVAMKQEEERIQQNWPPQYHYKQKSFYSASLKRYFKIFDKSQIKIILHEDYHKNTVKTFHEITRFLGVDDNFIPDISRRHNIPRGIAKYPLSNTLFIRPHLLKSLLRPILPIQLRNYLRNNFSPRQLIPRPLLDSSIRKDLTQIYVEDILELQDLIQKDLSAWLK